MSEHHYLSTACIHDLCHICRLSCKYCGQTCLCLCHARRDVEVRGGYPAVKENSS